MENQDVKPDKKRRFFKNIHGKKRFILFTGIYLTLFLIFFIVSAEITSRPSFCPTCHYMETFHQSWRTSAHNKVDCIECHMEPGVSGMIKGKVNGLVMVVNYVTQSYKNRKPWAEIPDNTCTRADCHETQAFKDTLYSFKDIMFSHKNHLGELRRGKKLKCLSCHSQIVQGTHIQVTTSTCFNCHFKNAEQNQSSRIFECKTCHDWNKLSNEQMHNYRYDHLIVKEKKLECVRCHNNVVSGEGLVEKERCFQCHFERDKLEKYDEIDTMHNIHITQHNIPCSYCHSQILHRIQKGSNIISRECKKCHTEGHLFQANIYSGENGYNTEPAPSKMYSSGINCEGCHVSETESHHGMTLLKAGKNSCVDCHDKQFENLLVQWDEATTKHINEISSIYSMANERVLKYNGKGKDEALNLLKQSDENIRMVVSGKSVHNILYTDKLFRGSYELLKKALIMIGSEYNLPEYLPGVNFIPNECYSCHTGVEHFSKKVFDMNFSHEKHIIGNNVTCSKCHSNDVKHGKLIVNKQNCNSCHHTAAKTDDECSKCHPLQNKIYTGNYLGKGLPDYMKSAGVKCIDCHVSSSEVMKPEINICLRCHDNEYKEMAKEWENEFKKMLSEAATLLNNIQEDRLNDEQRAGLKEVRQIINDLKLYRSIFVHNHELISSVLSDKLKFLKGIQFAVK